MPVAYFLTPKGAFAPAHEANMAVNQRRLTTAYDLHRTLWHMALYPEVGGAALGAPIARRTTPVCSERHTSIKIFVEIVSAGNGLVSERTSCRCSTPVNLRAKL